MGVCIIKSPKPAFRGEWMIGDNGEGVSEFRSGLQSIPVWAGDPRAIHWTFWVEKLDNRRWRKVKEKYMQTEMNNCQAEYRNALWHRSDTKGRFRSAWSLPPEECRDDKTSALSPTRLLCCTWTREPRRHAKCRQSTCCKEWCGCAKTASCRDVAISNYVWGIPVFNEVSFSGHPDWRTQSQSLCEHRIETIMSIYTNSH